MNDDLIKKIIEMIERRIRYLEKQQMRITSNTDISKVRISQLESELEHWQDLLKFIKFELSLRN